MADLFETFRGGANKPASTRLYASINPRKRIGLNRQVIEFLGRPQAVVLQFNKERSIIAIAPVKPDHADAFPVQYSRDGHITINAAPFIRHFGISVRVTERFTDVKLTHDGKVYLDLTTTVRSAR